jgi:hypothetical protein
MDVTIKRSADAEICFVREDGKGLHYLVFGEGDDISYCFVGKIKGVYECIHLSDDNSVRRLVEKFIV